MRRPRRGQAARVLTGSVEVDHEAVPHVLLDQLQRPLEYLSRPRLLHGVGVPRVAEQGQQVVGRAGTAGGSGAKEDSGPLPQQKSLASENVTCLMFPQQFLQGGTIPDSSSVEDNKTNQQNQTLKTNG